MDKAEAKDTVYKFFELSNLTRVSIVRVLGLIEEEEEFHKATDFQVCFKRARDKKLSDKLRLLIVGEFEEQQQKRKKQ